VRTSESVSIVFLWAQWLTWRSCLVGARGKVYRCSTKVRSGGALEQIDAPEWGCHVTSI
jgi:hypothetical protein